MSAHWPNRLTGMIARVTAVMAASILVASILKVRGSISTKTGFAPTSAMTSAVAMKLNGVVMTSSPRPMPSAINAINSVSVPLLAATQCLTPT
jgi:predicted anti-sigma-YlaC factor YlaD